MSVSYLAYRVPELGLVDLPFVFRDKAQERYSTVLSVQGSRRRSRRAAIIACWILEKNGNRRHDQREETRLGRGSAGSG